jgi:predicted Zn-dependent peptidase
MKTVELLGRTLKTLSIIALISVLIGLLPKASFAQTTEPQREQLLNGLRILLLSRPGDQNVLLKLRIHSGAAFDPAGKSGTMALLGDILFPDAATRDYFTEEMGGRLDVETNQDAINITLQGRAAEYDRIVDIMRAALVTTQLTPENVAKIRGARIKTLSEAKSSPADLANRAIAERLFGSFPYANSPVGTVESLARIERADLMLAREKFLSPNNATLVIIGGVDQRRAMRALRQLLGGWRKSDQLVPATFRQPAQSDPRTLIANSSGTQTAEVRLATRGLARADRDYFAATLLAGIARERWQKLVPDFKDRLFVKQEAYLLPGMFMMGAAVDNAAVAKTLESARSVLKSLVDAPVLPGEFENARRNASMMPGSGLSQSETMANAWLDIETYALPTISEQTRAWNSLSPADLQRVSVRLFTGAAIASVVVGNVVELKAQLPPALMIEVAGEVKPKAEAPQTTTTTVEPTKRRAVPVLNAPKNPNPLMKNTRPVTKPD